MTTNDNIDALALQIYDKHREAIDLIIKAKPAFEAKGWSILDSAMQRHERLFRSDFDNRLHHRFYAPDLNQSQGGMCICRKSGTGLGVSQEGFGP